MKIDFGRQILGGMYDEENNYFGFINDEYRLVLLVERLRGISFITYISPQYNDFINFLNMSPRGNSELCIELLANIVRQTDWVDDENIKLIQAKIKMLYETVVTGKRQKLLSDSVIKSLEVVLEGIDSVDKYTYNVLVDACIKAREKGIPIK